MTYEQHGVSLDSTDPLASIREVFEVDDSVRSYLDGNSLGRMPKAARETLEAVGSAWASRLIRGWNEGWYDLSHRIGAKIAPLIGAHPDEVIIADSTSVSLYKLAKAVLDLDPTRPEIISDAMNFPSDLYVLSGIAPLQIAANPREAVAAISDRTGLVSLSHVEFKSGARADVASITSEVKAQCAQVLWDLSHSVGAVPIDLHAAGVDFAVGCTYKYLNGGPGAPAFLYISREWQERLDSPIRGWFGTGEPFQFGLDYQPARGISRFLTGTPPIASLALIEAGVDILNQVGMDAVDTKRVRMTEWLIDVLENELGCEVVTPRNPAARGSHISFRHEGAWGICQALIQEHQVIPDFRAPDIVRLGVAPLYTSYREVGIGLDSLSTVLATESWRSFQDVRLAVT